MRTSMLLAAALFLLPSSAHAEERARATPKEAELLANRAVEFLQKEGKEKALAAFNDPKGPFTYLDLYVLALDLQGTVVAHGRNQKLIGNNDTQKTDAAGNPHFARRMLEIGNGPGQGWMQYTYENPQSHKEETKVAFVKRAGDLIIVCGVFRPNAK